MHRFSVLLFLLVVTTMIVGGCGRKASEQAAAEKVHGPARTAARPPAEGSGAFVEPEDVKTEFDNLASIEPRLNPELTDKKAWDLMGFAYARLGHIVHPNFALDYDPDADWYPLWDEYDTFDGMVAFLTKAFTPTAAFALVERHCTRYSLQDGRYHQSRSEAQARMQPAPGQTDYYWPETRIKPVFESENGDTRRYALLLPGYVDDYPDDGEPGELVTYMLQFVELRLDPQGWRVNSEMERE